MVEYQLDEEVKKRLEENKMKIPTNRDNSEERIRLREKIKKDIIRNIKKMDIHSEKRLDIVMGNPGSGKNSVISIPLREKYKSFILDNDDIKEVLPEFDDGLGAFVVHEESSDIANDLFKTFIKMEYNLIFPMVGRTYKSITDKVDFAKKNGYEVHLHFCDLSLEKTAERIVQRFRETNRYVSLDYLMNQVQDNPRNNYEIAKKERLCDSYTMYDNDVEKGEKAIEIEALDHDLKNRYLKELNIHMSDEELEEFIRNEVEERLSSYDLERG